MAKANAVEVCPEGQERVCAAGSAMPAAPSVYNTGRLRPTTSFNRTVTPTARTADSAEATIWERLDSLALGSATIRSSHVAAASPKRNTVLRSSQNGLTSATLKRSKNGRLALSQGRQSGGPASIPNTSGAQ